MISTAPFGLTGVSWDAPQCSRASRYTFTNQGKNINARTSAAGFLLLSSSLSLYGVAHHDELPPALSVGGFLGVDDPSPQTVPYAVPPIFC